MHRAGAIYGGPEIYSKLKEMFLGADNISERLLLMSALTAVNSSALVNETLNLSLTKYIQPQVCLHLSVPLSIA